MEKQVIQSTGFRNITENGEVTGFQLKIRLPYYRGVFLSQIKPGHLHIDNEVFGEDEIQWQVGGRRFTYAQMRQDGQTHWNPMEPAVLIVRKPGGLSRGYHDISYGFCCTHSYMPPFMDAIEGPDRDEVIYFVEFGHNIHKRRLIIV